ncbi:uncharacterized protein F5147DRAFT_658674 [Suillus discolor]|uniref:Uncharacterized protein n=1 Tax=Suillus discolor TaxID=1912936 RepID=A0A9P7JMB1_9AGAM|nr:uncharacterized protein F5147DRAFT_658674 [Suillus discolor]KAG2088555.1 hypothetical protein F5147DRAFT_658674 [Suillus discolor]
MLDLADVKKMASKLRYDTARAALIVLGPILGKVAWEGKLRVLHVADLRPLGDIGPGQSEGARDISWIWKAPGALHNDDAGLQDCLRIEWCKARAREGRGEMGERSWNRSRHIRLAMVKHVQELWVAVPSIVESQLLPDDEENTAETSGVLLTMEGLMILYNDVLLPM